MRIFHRSLQVNELGHYNGFLPVWSGRERLDVEFAMVVALNPFSKIDKKWRIRLAWTCWGVVLVTALIYMYVEFGDYPIFKQVADVPPTPAAIVFGAGIESREAHDRVATAAALYKAGKVQKLLMTGDNGHVNYNEPAAMKRSAIALGVPATDIICDYAGFRTYDSLYRARNIFEVNRAVLVTQRYHLPRAMFLAQRLGLNVVGMDAGVRSYGIWQIWYDLREVGAAEAAWLDILTERKSKFLGKKEPLFAPTNP